MKKSVLFASVGIVVVLAIVAIALLISTSKPKEDRAKSNSTSDSITSQGDWEGGTYSLDNIDTASLPGSIELRPDHKIDLSGKTTTAEINSSDAGNPIDSNLVTFWGYLVTGDPTECRWWKLDLGESITGINKVKANAQGYADATIGVQHSTNDIDYTNLTTFVSAGSSWQSYTINPAIESRYLKYNLCSNIYHGVGSHLDIFELEVYAGPVYATHTSAATQIDGSEGGTKQFIAWETFTPSYTKPANTTVSFRFRTSSDHATWTSWSAYQTPASAAAFDISAIVDSGSGANKYLQVETTLANTDGVSTPIVDSYSVQYHTDVKPNKPTAATVVVQ